MSDVRTTRQINQNPAVKNFNEGNKKEAIRSHLSQKLLTNIVTEMTIFYILKIFNGFYF